MDYTMRDKIKSPQLKLRNLKKRYMKKKRSYGDIVSVNQMWHKTEKGTLSHFTSLQKYKRKYFKQTGSDVIIDMNMRTEQ